MTEIFTHNTNKEIPLIKEKEDLHLIFEEMNPIY